MTISDNICDSPGGGIFLFHSNSILTHVTITDNYSTIYGAGLALFHSNSTLNFVTISDNAGGITSISSNFNITNSIVWKSFGSAILILVHADEEIITYSDIKDDSIWPGEGNINSDPIFVDPKNNDYTLQENSPCIDAGNQNPWYNDINGTRADMGATGGSLTMPNFTSYDFGEVGDIESSADFLLYNFRETPITINSVSFIGNTFSTSTSFPVVINSLTYGVITIDCAPQIFGYIEDDMTFNSTDLPEDLSVELLATGSEGNLLSGDLSGVFPAAIYRITGDISVQEGDSLILLSGTEFLFDGEYNFTIKGVLKAVGTEQDSIIFDSYDQQKWKGLMFEGVTEETILNYVYISGGQKVEGGGMALYYSHPILKNITISGNIADYLGGGIALSYSNPYLLNMNISDNSAYHGGGMYLSYSSPTLTGVTFSNNTVGSRGGGIHLVVSSISGSYLFINNNYSGGHGTGIFISAESEVSLYNTTIVGNMVGGGDVFGAGIYSDGGIVNLINSIIYYNRREGDFGINYNLNGYTMEYLEEYNVSYSDIEGDENWMPEGVGNISLNPEFVDHENGNYDLNEGSPCIDAGTADLDGDGFEDITDYNGQAPDMGAYEFEGSSQSGDLNGDGLINILDIVVVVNIVLGNTEPVGDGDLNGDGMLNILDVVILVNIILNG